MYEETLHEQEERNKQHMINTIDSYLDRKLPAMVRRGQRKLNRGKLFEVTFIPYTYVRIGAGGGSKFGINHKWFDALIEEKLGPGYKSHTRFEPYPFAVAMTTITLLP